MKIKATVSPKASVVAKKFTIAIDSANHGLGLAVAEATLAIHEQAVRGIMQRSSGKRVTRYNPKREVVVSKPGQPPNVDLGTFVRSVQFEVYQTDLAGYVGTNDVRGSWFEFGTKTMAARPWLTPAWKKAQKTISSIFRKIKIKVD